MGRARRSLEEEDCSTLLLLELLGGQAVERRRPHAGLLGADGMRRVVEENCLERTVASTKRQNGQLRVERPGRTHGIVPRANPVDRPVGEQQPAVPAHRRLLAHAEEERAGGQPAVRRRAGLDDLVLDLPGECLFPVIAVDRHRRRGVVRMGRVDEDVIKRNSRFPLQPSGRAIEDVALDHEHVAGDQRDPLTRGTFDHNGRGPQFALLPVGLARADPAADHQRIIGLQHGLRRARFQFAGCQRWRKKRPEYRRADQEVSHVLARLSGCSCENTVEFLGFDGLLLDQPRGDTFQRGPTFFKDAPGQGLGFVDDPSDLEVDLPGGVLAPFRFRRVRSRQPGAGRVVEPAQDRTHAELDDHAPGDLRGPLKIAGAAVGGFSQGNLLGQASGQKAADRAAGTRSGYGAGGLPPGDRACSPGRRCPGR